MQVTDELGSRAEAAPAQLNPKLVKWGLLALVIAALAELVLWRTFSRIGATIKGTLGPDSPFVTVHDIGSEIGRITLNFAVVLAVLFFGIVVLRLRELGYFGQNGVSRREWLPTLAVAAIFVTLGLTFLNLYLVQSPLVSLALRLTLLAGFGILALDFWRRNPVWQARLFIALLYGAYTVQIVAKMLHDEQWLLGAAGESYRINYYVPTLMAGEALVLLNGVVVYLLYGGGWRSMARNWRALLGALVVTGAFVGLSFVVAGQSSIVPILGLYALGFTMQLLPPLYAIALFFLAYTVFYNLGRLREGATPRAVAFGLILIFTGGYLFNISNQYLFALTGVLLLARPELVKDW